MNRHPYVFYTQLKYYQPNLIKRLPASESLRATQLKKTARQQLYILGRALLAEALEQFTGDSDFQLNYLDKGKPELIKPSQWQLNFTHSGEHLFLVLYAQSAIGIDSEMILPRNYQRLSEKLFSEKEQTAITNADLPIEAFYRYWTCYEAQIKYLGLSVFSELPDLPKRFLKSYRHEHLVFSLCSDKKINHISFYQHDFTRPIFANQHRIITLN